MGITAACHLDQLLDDMFRRLIRVTHAEVDDVLPSRSRLRLELTDNVKNVRRQAIYTGELVVHFDFSVAFGLENED